MSLRQQIARPAVALGMLVALATVVHAGPPLICHPFDPGTARLLPWDTARSGWNTPDRAYDIKSLTADTVRLLSPDAPVLARMENLRRATIYAMQDERIAAELLSAVVGRAQSDAGKGRDPLAWFDAGYLIESYKQASSTAKRDMLAATALDGYAMVKKALLLAGANPEMEFAASLMKSGEASADHRRRALAGAPADSLLARNLATH
ncbi:MAG TPA: hypothetical protein VFO14_04960 [Vicinamibacterales bacterium]|nr:hypothetical protein [Vicinamibacterales bacterium]